MAPLPHRCRAVPEGVTLLDLTACVGPLIAKRLGLHYTPKHRSWLNIAEIEFSAFSRIYFRQPDPKEESLCREVQALEQERNQAQACINWQFTDQDANAKLCRLYPRHS